MQKGMPTDFFLNSRYKPRNSEKTNTVWWTSVRVAVSQPRRKGRHVLVCISHAGKDLTATVPLGPQTSWLLLLTLGFTERRDNLAFSLRMMTRRKEHLAV
jgi:hypothetical protein